MKILVLNSGSSSLKYQLFDMDNQEVLAKWLVERIWIEGSKIKHKTASGIKHDVEGFLENHEVALNKVLNLLIDPEVWALKDLKEIDAVGHRMVHGWESFSKSTLITDEVKKTFKELTDLAPLHNPANLMGVEAVEKVLPWIPNVGVFDTAFHQTMKPENFLYALPYKRYEEYKIRRFNTLLRAISWFSRNPSTSCLIPVAVLCLILLHSIQILSTSHFARTSSFSISKSWYFSEELPLLSTRIFMFIIQKIKNLF